MINLTRMFTVDEGLKNRVYKDTKGNNTVGIGFNMDNPAARACWIHADIPESFNLVYNGQQALATTSVWNLLNKCIDYAKTDTIAVFPEFNVYPEYVQLALLNLMFNMGKPKFSGFHTFIKLIRAKDFTSAANDLATTLWATQVPKRSMRVCALLRGDDSLYAN